MKVGSSLDSQIWYEPYQAREFRLFMKSDLLSSFLISLWRLCSVCLFLVFMKPVLDTSKQFSVHLYPAISVRNGVYLVVSPGALNLCFWSVAL